MWVCSILTVVQDETTMCCSLSWTWQPKQSNNTSTRVRARPMVYLLLYVLISMLLTCIPAYRLCRDDLAFPQYRMHARSTWRITVFLCTLPICTPCTFAIYRCYCMHALGETSAKTFMYFRDNVSCSYPILTTNSLFVNFVKFHHKQNKIT